MKEQFVTYEIALKLKELGFDEDCFVYKLKEDSPMSFCLMCGTDANYLKDSKIDIKGAVCVPLWQQVIDWFREKHNLHINLEIIGVFGQMYNYKIISTGTILLPVKERGITCLYGACEKSRYKAQEQGILKAIDLTKTK